MIFVNNLNNYPFLNLIDHSQDGGIRRFIIKFSEEKCDPKYFDQFIKPDNWERFASRRKVEYAATRLSLMVALKEHYGVEVDGVINDEDRSPIWPEGIMGSISHSKDHVFIALSDNKKLAGIGIDIERLDRARQLSRITLVLFPKRVGLLQGTWP